MAVKPLVLPISADTSGLAKSLRDGKTVLADFGKSAQEMVADLRDKFSDATSIEPAAMAQKMGQNMQQMFTEMRRGAQAAIDQGKDFDPLGGMNSSSMLSAADGYEKLAAAMRIRANASAAVVASGEQEALVLKQVAVASEVTAAEFEKQAAALRTQAGVFAQIEAEMGDAADRGANRVVAGHNRMGVSSQIFMHSIRATSDSFAAGMPPMMIFTEQLSRLSEGMMYAAQESGATEGAMARFASVMSGPFGIAIILGVSVLGTLVSHMDLFQDKLGEATKKLKDQAEATELSDKAQQIFDATLDGSIVKQKQMNDALEQELHTREELANIKATQAQQDAATDKRNFDKAKQDLATAKSALDAENSAGAPQPGVGGMGFNPAAGAAANRQSAARANFDKAYDAYQTAERQMRISALPVLDFRAAALADPKEAARQKIDAQREVLRQKSAAGLVSDDDYVQQEADLQRQEDAIGKKERKPRTRKPPKDPTPANDDAYTALWDRLTSSATGIGGQNNTSIEDKAQADRNKVAVALQKQIDEIRSQGRQHDWSDKDVQDAVTLAQLSAGGQTAEINAKEKRDISLRDIEKQQQALDMQDQILELQGQLATNMKDRLAIATQLLDNQKKRSSLSIDADELRQTITAPEADARRQNLDQQDALKRTLQQKQNRGPLATYQDDLKKSTGDMNTALQNVEVDGLKGLTDGLTGLISGTENVSQAFRRMATSILADLARIAVEKMIVGALGLSLNTGGKVDGRATGGLVAFRSGGLPGYAGGTRLSSGKISGPGTGTSDSILALVSGSKPIAVSNGEGIVTEQAVKNYWPIIDSMNKGTFPKFAAGGLPGGGSASLSYPSLPSAASVRQPGMMYAPYIDVRGAVVTQDILDQANEMAQYHAARAASAALAAAPDLSVQQMSRINNNRIPS